MVGHGHSRHGGVPDRRIRREPEVGAVDSVGAALAGGLIAGAIIGTAQWLALKQFVPWHWIVATSLGMGAGLAVGAAVVDYGIDRPQLMLMGAISGLVVGALQAFVLGRQGFAGALWWAALNLPTWALAWLISSYVISANIKEQFTNFGASGVLLFALVTCLLLAWMFRIGSHRRPQLEPRPCDGSPAGRAPDRVQHFLPPPRPSIRLPLRPAQPGGHGSEPIPRRRAAAQAPLVRLDAHRSLARPVGVLLGQVLARDDLQIIPVATVVGVLAAAVQFLGLARWPFLVPALARAYESPDSSQQHGRRRRSSSTP